MRAIAVDDEAYMLETLEEAIRSSVDIESVESFSSCSSALSYISENEVDVAFLDINMRGIGGLELAKKIVEAQPQCRIVFCTGYGEYAVDAFQLHASGYLMKPITAQDVQKEIDYIKGSRETEKLLTVKCFGNFDVSCDGEKLTFKRTKSKEMLAYLIDRKGAEVSWKDIAAALWEDSAKLSNRNYLNQLLFDVRQTFEKVGVSDVLKKNGYLFSVDTEKISCDYYSYLKTGKPEFHGEYMTQYSWADETCGLLWSKENK